MFLNFKMHLVLKNALKAQRIVQYFEANPKDHPLQMIYGDAS